MAKLFTIELEGKTPKPFGVGPKIVMGIATFGPDSEAIHAEDVNLKNIKAIFFMQDNMASVTETTLDSPGSYANYASLVCYDMAGTGRFTTLSAGTITTRFLAVGE